MNEWEIVFTDDERILENDFFILWDSLDENVKYNFLLWKSIIDDYEKGKIDDEVYEYFDNNLNDKKNKK